MSDFYINFFSFRKLLSAVVIVKQQTCLKYCARDVETTIESRDNMPRGSQGYTEIDEVVVSLIYIQSNEGHTQYIPTLDLNLTT